MTTKGPSCKQVIISISDDNTNTFFKDSSSHVTNINRVLKNIKLEVMADFICIENKSVIITTNKVASLPDLQNIEKYVKNTYNIEAEHTESPRFLQSKSFLKIISIPYISKSSNSCITSEKIEKFIKNNHIFYNIILVSKSQVIKVLPKSDMSIMWINIWDAQSGIKAKSLINRKFNFRSFIATIQGANMNWEFYSVKTTGNGVI